MVGVKGARQGFGYAPASKGLRPWWSLAEAFFATSAVGAQRARCGFATRSPIGRHPYTAVLTFVQLANQQRAEIDVPFPRPEPFESDVIPDKGFSHIPPDSLPRDFTVAPDPALLPCGRVFPGRHTSREPTVVLAEQLRGS